jgi:hypothetical protein
VALGDGPLRIADVVVRNERYPAGEAQIESGDLAELMREESDMFGRDIEGKIEEEDSVDWVLGLAWPRVGSRAQTISPRPTVVVVAAPGLPIIAGVIRGRVVARGTIRVLRKSIGILWRWIGIRIL